MVQVSIENAGTTTAKYLEQHLSFQSRPDVLPKGWDYPDLWSDSNRDVAFGYLGPKAKGTLSPDRPISVVGLGWANAIQNNARLHLYMWGWVSYFDVFKGTPKHLTEFCYEVIPFVTPTKIPTKVNVMAGYRRCVEHNCADEQCADYREKTQQK